MTDTNDKPAVNFAVLQSVEDYVENSGKFRTKCASFKIPGRDSGGANTVYIPYCDKQRFDFGHQLNEYRGHGVFKPPEIGKPWQIPDFIVFREHFHDIHCPQPCRGYRNKRVAALLKKLWPRVPAAGKWTRKEIVTAVVVPVVVGLVAALLGWLTPEGRRLLHLDKPQPQQQTSSVSGSIVNNGGVINNPTINNATPPKAGLFELTEERRNGFLKLLSAQTAPRDTVRIGCTSWSEKSCVAAGRFLLLLSEAGWQIEENKVFRLEPQIPIVGVTITTRTAADEPKEPLPPHLGRWRLMDESHKTIYWAFRSLDIPVGGATDNTLKDGTLGIYFGSEPQ
jgi:hypothetical protein